MAIPTVELQKSIYNKLSTNYSVFESKPINQPFPYILIGDDITTNNLTKDKKRTNHNITIHSFTKDKSSLNSKTMNYFIKDSIENGLAVEGFYTGMITLEMMMTLKEEATDGIIYHGVIEYEIGLTEK